ncbi:hypothetical protein CA13_43160 [Planctomycetes bacterium CA13]|uniref:Uncharacterized protein n=1 Tax=Novipirellula herctigrandis TaxID=2527986 RepID=A0A5C5Z8K0_9BACT|nr:hypothetical protein CA13_43160 [Planctomycetes bacterium CA13]
MGRAKRADEANGICHLIKRANRPAIISEKDADYEASERILTAKALRSLGQRDLEQYAMISMNLGPDVSRRLCVANECLFQWQQGFPFAAMH